MKVGKVNFVDWCPKLLTIATFIEQSENEGQIDYINLNLYIPMLKIY